MIEGFEIGHHTADSDGWLTGTTVVVAREGAVGGVDVRGGGPGTRETDLLNPTTIIERVHAVVLTGGSAYGLAAANGVMVGLEAAGIGFSAGLEPHQVVPIVPAAVLFDLGRGGVFSNRPTADFGALALAAATSNQPATGSVGAGTGAVCGGIKAGFGYAEKQIDSGVSVAAAVVVNAAGSAVDPTTGRLWADHLQLLATPTHPSERRWRLLTIRRRPRLPPPLVWFSLMRSCRRPKPASLPRSGTTAWPAPSGRSTRWLMATRCSVLLPPADRSPRIQCAHCLTSTRSWPKPPTFLPTPALTRCLLRRNEVPGRATPTWHPRFSAEIKVCRPSRDSYTGGCIRSMTNEEP